MSMTSGFASEQKRLEANALVRSLSMCPRGDLNFPDAAATQCRWVRVDVV
jgi:hypothetical protein